MNRGVIYAASAYLVWGLLPVYWKALQAVPAFEILSHRIVWALAVALAVVAARGQWRPLRAALRSWRTLLTVVVTALLIGLNWFIYIWAVNTGQIVQTSLGYFINPLANVLLGALVLRERLRVGQGAAFAVALAGVLVLTAQYGAVPWISLALAGSFALYGLLRKTALVGALDGLMLETLVLAPLALLYLLSREAQGGAAFGHAGLGTSLLLVGAGLVTFVPLLLFASAARQISMSALGILQYIAPTLQFTLGVMVYHEAFSRMRLIGFGLIWLALAIYTADSMRRGVMAARSRAVAGPELPSG